MEKVILTTTYRGHQIRQEQFRKDWEQHVLAPRNRFTGNSLE